MQITINVRDGATVKEIAAQLRMQAGLFEGMTPKEASSNENTLTSVETKTETTSKKSLAKEATKKAGAVKAQTSFEDDEETLEDDDEATIENANGAASMDSFEDDETEAESSDDDFMKEEKSAKPKEKAKAKKWTVSDVNNACKAKAQATDRKTVLGLLKKHFKVTSITELDQSQYGEVIKLMKA